MRLYIDSGKHASTDIEGRIERIESEFGDPEVVFTEDPVENSSATELLKSFIQAPLLMPVMSFWAYIFLPFLQLFTNKDSDVEEHFDRAVDADIIPADSPKISLITQHWYLWTAANWVPLGLVLILVRDYGYVSSWIILLTVLFGIGCALLFAFLSGQHSTRNTHIAQIIKENSSQYSRAVLVTGGDHHEEVAEILDYFEEVTVVNPDKHGNVG